MSQGGSWDREALSSSTGDRRGMVTFVEPHTKPRTEQVLDACHVDEQGDLSHLGRAQERVSFWFQLGVLGRKNPLPEYKCHDSRVHPAQLSVPGAQLGPGKYLCDEEGSK